MRFRLNDLARPVTGVFGVFRDQIAVLGSDEAKRLDREEELNAEELRGYRGAATANVK